MRRALVGVVLASLALPATASAHATMAAAEPAVQSRVDAAPGEVAIRFDQAVAIGAEPIEVLGEDGRVHNGPPVTRDRGRVVAVPVSGLREGESFTVRWRATSADGHTISGVYTVGIGIPAPPPTEAVGASGLTWRDDLARFGLFAALALVVGVLAFRLLVLPAEVPPALERRVHLLSTVAAFAAIDIGILGFVLRSQNALQLGLVDLLYGDLEPFATGTRFGVAWMVTTFGFAVCAMLLVLAWTLDRTWLRLPVLALGLALLAAFPLSGHQATEPNATLLGQLADWAHLVAAAIWVGGLVMLAAVVWPTAPRLRRAAFLRFSRLATVLVAVIVLAGTYVSIERLPAFGDLWGTSYGRVLLLKVVIACTALAWGGVHHLVVRPRLERGEPGGGRLGRSLAGESAVAMGVLLAAAVLVNGSPPPVSPDGSAAASASTEP